MKDRNQSRIRAAEGSRRPRNPWLERRAVNVLGVLATLLGSQACSEGPVECQVSVAQAPLTNGSERATYLSLAPGEEEAILELRIRLDPVGEERCSGVVVSKGLVLTAKHCAHELESPAVSAIFSLGDPVHQVEVGARVIATHPSLDLMVVALEEEPEELATVTPLGALTDLPTGFGPGSLLQTSGAGSDGRGQLGKRAFLVEALQQLTDDEFVVDAGSLGGACFGDSGGPLLVRDDSGSVRTLGVLASGSSNCFGQDRYTRLTEDVADWLRETAALEPVATTPNGSGEALGSSGRCFDNRAMWFEPGGIRVELCQADSVCGWSNRAHGFRCLMPDADACAGVSDLGRCEDGRAVRCESGRIQENPCSVCGFSCARSPQTGRAACLGHAN